jgi:hypothetical protein
MIDLCTWGHKHFKMYHGPGTYLEPFVICTIVHVCTRYTIGLWNMSVQPKGCTVTCPMVSTWYVSWTYLAEIFHGRLGMSMYVPGWSKYTIGLWDMSARYIPGTYQVLTISPWNMSPGYILVHARLFQVYTLSMYCDMSHGLMVSTRYVP